MGGGREGDKDDIKNNKRGGTSLVVQWLRLHASMAGGVGSIPGQGTKIPHAARPKNKNKKNNRKKDK